MSKKDGAEWDSETKQTSLTELSNNLAGDYSFDTKLPSGQGAKVNRGVKLLMWLIISSPEEHRGTVLPIAEGTIIGRHGDIPWDDPRMSRKHAKFIQLDDPINPENKVFAIAPEKDRNGTVINGKRIKTSTILYENDVIIMGNTRFIVKVLE